MPLFVVNGQPIDIADLNKYETSELKKIEEIKMVDALAIYGSKAQYGVVLLTIKK